MTATKKASATIAAVLAMVVFGLSSCSSDDSISEGEENVPEEPASEDTQVPTDPGSVVILEGEPFTCEQVTASESCGPATQEVFNKYKENIVVFVNSGNLGPLFNNSSFEDAAFAGLVACAMVDDGEEAYVEFMQKDPAFEDEPGTSFLPPWYEARASLCPSGMVAHGDVAVTP